MDLTLLKEIIIAVLFFAVFFCVFLPLNFAHNTRQNGVDLFHSRKYSRMVSLMNCFAAGIFLGTCLLHLFPDVRQNVTAAMLRIDPNQTFPLAEFTIAMGFFLLLTLEQIMADSRARRLKREAELRQLQARNNDDTTSLAEDDGDDRDENGRSQDVRVLVPSATIPVNVDIHFHGSHQSEETNPDDHSPLRITALILALSIHSTFEGIAIGVQPTEQDVLQITSALAIHKVVISFSLGLALVQSSLGMLKSALLGMVFASTTPLGIAIGLGVTFYEEDMNNSLVVGALQGMAAGTFLYVTFLDLLPHEFKSGDFHLPKLLTFILGFSVICAALFIFPDA